MPLLLRSTVDTYRDVRGSLESVAWLVTFRVSYPEVAHMVARYPPSVPGVDGKTERLVRGVASVVRYTHDDLAPADVLRCAG